MAIVVREKALKAEKTFRISATITGSMLLLLTLEMVLKYGFGVEIEAGGPFGFLALVPTDTVVAINISTWILIVHGWLYVFYLVTCFQLWTAMRWPITYFPLLALGGVVPFLSFITEGLVRRTVTKAFL
jgi:integral membrane protein